MEPRELLIYYSMKYHGDWDKIYQSIQNKEEFPNPKIVNDLVKDLTCNAITIIDEDYPESLKRCYKSPFVIYYYGDISLAKDMSKIVGIVGARNPSSYGIEQTIKFTKDISKYAVVISGLAKGIDSIAHETAINNGGKTIAVLGTAINKCYPIDNIDLYNQIKTNHLLISEYPPNSGMINDSFPLRNRIISALSVGLLITEAKTKSGTSITAMHTLGMGKTICCIPERVDVDSLCNQLIYQGATIALSGNDVLYELNVIKE
ncbi:MAG: DNA-processing protein DprA [Bacilli bacterium]|nr:DNA-processing protein DprA [Bacilli bacterium]